MRHTLCQGDCLKWLPLLPDEPIQMIFADVPDNIGLNYNEYKDNLSKQDYIDFLYLWTKHFVQAADTVWISFNSKWTLDMAHIAQNVVDDYGVEFKPCVQTFSFYQHNKNDFGSAHRPLWRFRKKDAGLYPGQAKIESWRQKNGDKRAAEGGKVPGDHFDFPRVTGNSKQRRPFHPTQLHEGLVERCVLLSTKPGDWVVDTFGGTGTTLRVCRKTGRQCTLIEIDPTYCKYIANEHEMKIRIDGEKYKRWEKEFDPNENYTTIKYKTS